MLSQDQYIIKYRRCLYTLEVGVHQSFSQPWRFRKSVKLCTLAPIGFLQVRGVSKWYTDHSGYRWLGEWRCDYFIMIKIKCFLRTREERL